MTAVSNPKATPANRRSIKSNENNPDTTTIPASEFIEHLTHERVKENNHLQSNGNSNVIEQLTTCGNLSSDEQHLKENSKK